MLVEVKPNPGISGLGYATSYTMWNDKAKDTFPIAVKSFFNDICNSNTSLGILNQGCCCFKELKSVVHHFGCQVKCDLDIL